MSTTQEVTTHTTVNSTNNTESAGEYERFMKNQELKVWQKNIK